MKLAAPGSDTPPSSKRRLLNFCTLVNPFPKSPKNAASAAICLIAGDTTRRARRSAVQERAPLSASAPKKAAVSLGTRLPANAAK